MSVLWLTLAIMLEVSGLETDLDAAKRHIGELSMEVELLRRERDLRRPLALRRSWK